MTKYILVLICIICTYIVPITAAAEQCTTSTHDHEADISLNPLQKKQSKILCAAIKAQNKQNVASLLHQKVSVHTQSNRNYQPIHLAAMQSNTEMLSFLLEQNAYINALGNRGYTPLHLAIMRGHDKNVTLLLEKNADINIPNRHNDTSFHIAASVGSPTILTSVLQHEYLFSNLNSCSANEALQQTMCIVSSLSHLPRVITTMIIEYKNIETTYISLIQTNDKKETALTQVQNKLATEFDAEKQINLKQCIKILEQYHDTTLKTLIKQAFTTLQHTPPKTDVYPSAQEPTWQ